MEDVSLHQHLPPALPHLQQLFQPTSACAATAAELHEATALPRLQEIIHSLEALVVLFVPSNLLFERRRVGLSAVLRPLKHWEALPKQQLSEFAPTRWGRNPSLGWTVASGQRRLKSLHSLAMYALALPLHADALKGNQDFYGLVRMRYGELLCFLLKV